MENVLAAVQRAGCGPNFFRDLGDKGNFDLLRLCCVLFNESVIKQLSDEVCSCILENLQ